MERGVICLLLELGERGLELEDLLLEARYLGLEVSRSAGCLGRGKRRSDEKDAEEGGGADGTKDELFYRHSVEESIARGEEGARGRVGITFSFFKTKPPRDPERPAAFRARETPYREPVVSFHTDRCYLSV